MSSRQLVRQAWKTRVETAGYPVSLGKVPTPGPDDPPKVIALLFTDAVTVQGRKKFHRTTVHVHALADTDLEEMVTAIKTAVETADHEVAGLPVEPVSEQDLRGEDGSTTVGAVLSYACTWQETWGAP
jgi:hypothetical protein